MSKQEIVEVVLKLPKALVDFMRAMEGDVQKYLEHCIVDLHVSYVESVCDDEKEHPGDIMDRFGLRPVFKSYGVLPSYYKDC